MTSFEREQEEEQSLIGLMSAEGTEKGIIWILYQCVHSVQVGWRDRSPGVFCNIQACSYTCSCILESSYSQCTLCFCRLHCVLLYVWLFIQIDDHITLKQSSLTFRQKVFLIIKSHLIPRGGVQCLFSPLRENILVCHWCLITKYNVISPPASTGESHKGREEKVQSSK